MKVLNLWGGAGTGKSTAAAGLFYEMKKLKLNVELVTEYAKDVTWERRYELLDDQIYIFAKQQRRISRLANHGIDWVITDCPLALGLVYAKDDLYSDAFPKLVIEMFNTYDNYNFLLQRHFEYNPIGRNQKDVEEAKKFDVKITDLINKWNIKVSTIYGGEIAVDKIIKEIVLPNI